MSFDYVKSIVMKEDKVYFTSADSSLRPLLFSKWEVKFYSDMLKEKGREAVLARIGEDIWDGNLRLYKGSKICNLFLQAKGALPKALHWSNTDSKAVGKYLASAVLKLESNPQADLSADVTSLIKLRNDRDYILEAAHRTGHNFLNFADEELQKDKELALKVLRAANGAAWFEYPNFFKTDKEVALEALKTNGCLYRSLDKSLQAEHEIIIEAFNESDSKKYHEHLPDVIPIEAFGLEIAEKKVSYDTDFAIKLITCCPSLHIHRSTWLLEDRDVALKWCEVGKWIPNDVTYLPEKYAKEKEFQDILLSRCEGKSFEFLEKILNEKGVSLQKSSLDDMIKDAFDERKVLSASEKEHVKER